MAEASSRGDLGGDPAGDSLPECTAAERGERSSRREGWPATSRGGPGGPALSRTWRRARASTSTSPPPLSGPAGRHPPPQL